MGFKRDTISIEEWKERAGKVISAEQRNRQWAEELFFLHNDKLTPRETGIGCGGCRNRVFNRLLNYFNSL